MTEAEARDPERWSSLARELRRAAAQAAATTLREHAFSDLRLLDGLRLHWLRHAAREATLCRGFGERGWSASRLALLSVEAAADTWPCMDAGPLCRAELPPESLGWWLEGIDDTLCEWQSVGSHVGGWRSQARRRRAGAYYTPYALVARVVDRALCAPARDAEARKPAAALGDPWSVCDPACGAGAFLIEAARRLLGQFSTQPRGELLARSVHGCDIDPVALAVTELSLWWLSQDTSVTASDVGRGLRLLDATTLRPSLSTEPFTPRLGFDVLLGNPPWISFAGRAAQPLEQSVRERLRRDYSAFGGYPTLHGVFVELGALLAPHGVVALLLPSSVADLEGYGPARRALTSTHSPLEPLEEFGEDAFEEVTQPCFALVAVPDARPPRSESPWRLAERAKACGQATSLELPPGLAPWLGAEPLPEACFRELGFQSNREVTARLLHRPPPGRPSPPVGEDWVALLEGRDVSAFTVGNPRLYLQASAVALREAGVRLRPRETYAQVDFLVRQTAKFPIAARHVGLAFRNSLIAGMAQEDLSAELLIGLLNSALFRGLHLVSHRDARQAAFPQVKVAHLRALPRPPSTEASRRAVATLAHRCASRGHTPELQVLLDRAVFDLYAIPEAQRAPIWELVTRSAGRQHPLPPEGAPGQTGGPPLTSF